MDHFAEGADTDEREWTRARDGDGEAFGRVFDRHRRRVHLHALRLAPTFDDADDVVAITFLEAWRRRDGVRFVGGSILPWLLVTATNVARNLSRSARRYRAVLQELPAAEAGAAPVDRLEMGHAELALQRLAPAHRAVVTLCILEGYSEQEAAAALGIAPGTVKSRLSRAKARMRVMLLPTHPESAISSTGSTS
jgi:RNA polymerase sigma factor (sigma-70 family)